MMDCNTPRKASARPMASWMTIVGVGVLTATMGVAFVFWRPLFLLLPEDQRFVGITPNQLKALNGQLFVWIGMVFRSWGSFAVGLGTLMAWVGGTAYRVGDSWAWWALAVTGLSTFSIFLVVNVMLDSDFKFVIAVLAGSYIWALWYGRRTTAALTYAP